MHSTKLGEEIFSEKKADLHVHLNGAIPTSLVKNLLDRFHCELPKDFDCSTDLQVLTPVSSLGDYFRPWLALKLLPRGKECLNEMVHGATDYLCKDGTTYVEFRNSPFNIARVNSISLDEAVEWLIESSTSAEEQTGIKVRLVLSLSRYDFDKAMGESLLKSIKRSNAQGYVVGLDLSGDEDSPIPADSSLLFKKAKEELDLGVSIHAGETGHSNNIIWAIRDCGADRIGHGLAALQSPTVVEMIIEQDICVEVCLRTSLVTGQIKNIEDHPVSKFIDLGIPFVLCSDNPAIHGTTLSQDYRTFADLTKRDDLLAEMFDRQMRYAFGRK